MNLKTLKNPAFNVNRDDAYFPGVYKIENKKYIYIGSTKTTLANRFNQHYRNEGGNHTKTCEILHDGGDFTCLESFTTFGLNEIDEQNLRDAEAKYIRLFKTDEKIMLNENLPENFSKTDKIKYKNLKIPINLYDDVVNELDEKGYLIMGNTMYHKKFDPFYDEDDLLSIYGYDVEDCYYESEMKKHNKDIHEPITYKVISMEKDPPYNVYVVIDNDGTQEKYSIYEAILDRFFFSYYLIDEQVEGMEQTVPETIRIDKITDEDGSVKFDVNEDDLSSWLGRAYDYLHKKTFEEQ